MPGMHELDRMLSQLRISLADVELMEKRLNTLKQQFTRQNNRIPSQAIYGQNDLGTILKAMSEVEDRLQDVNDNLRRLSIIKKRAIAEIEALELTRNIELAKARINELRNREHQGEMLSQDLIGEIQKLEKILQDASELAARSITVRSKPDETINI